MADGDNTASGMGMGMIIGLLIVLVIVIGGGVYMFSGRTAPTPIAAVALTAGHTITGSATVN